MSDHASNPLRGGRSWPLATLVLGAVFALLVGATAVAVHEAGPFELDGNSVPNSESAPLGPGDDWDQVYAGTSSAAVTAFAPDVYSATSGDNQFDKGSKDTLDISEWHYKEAVSPSDKTDLENAYAALYSGDPEYLYLGADRVATNGNAKLGFWILQDHITLNANGTFGGIHKVGDLLIESAYTAGGTDLGNINVWEWQGDDGAAGHLSAAPILTGQDCRTSSAGDTVCSVNNHETITVAWPYQGKKLGNDTPAFKDIFAGGFNETGIDLSYFFPDGIPCFSNVLAETRSAGSSVDSSTEDFVLGSFTTCGTINAHKYNDINGNGSLDAATDVGLSGWTIKLYDSTGNTLLDTKVTDSNGDVSFTDVEPGTYKVCEDLLSSSWVNTDPGGSAPYCKSVTLALGGTESRDFGNFELVSKSGTKYVDANGDGDISSDSAYTGGWTIRLYKENASANGMPDASEYVTSMPTDGSGDYSFGNLGPGTYFVCEAADSAWIQTFPNTTGSEVINTCANANDAGNSRTNADYGYTFTTSSGSDLTGNDFGNFELVSKSGTKYVDANGDGDISSDSAYTGGWTIRLYKENASANGMPDASEYVTSMPTDGSGDYSFGNLGPGTYFVCEAADSAWIQTFPNTTGSEVINTCANANDAGNSRTNADYGYTFTTSSGSDLTGNDFGNFELVSKSGTKYVDANGDGDISSDSAYTGGWTIRLYKENASANGMPDASEYVTSMPTDGSGDYSFGNLGPGTYFVCEAADSAWIQTFPNTTGSEVINTCANANDAGNSRTNADYGYTFTTSSGSDLTGNDFGNFELVSKSGTKYVDANGDGDISSDSAYTGGWDIKLYKDDGSGDLDIADTLVDTKTTDGSGDYSFGNLGPGTYFVCEVTQTAWTQTYPNASTSDPTGELIYDACNNLTGLAQYGYTFTTSSGTDLTGNDFGNAAPVSKSGTKYVDANGDGDISSDSAYTGGWDIKLYKDDGSGDLDIADTLVDTKTTDGSGDYSFGNLGPGTYFVCEVTQTAWTQTYPNASTSDPTGELIYDACNNLTGLAQYGYTFTTSPGTDLSGNDFGNFELVTKSGFKFNDNNENGVYEPLPNSQDDTKLSNWVIELWKLDGSWTFVQADATDSTGYSFTGLGPGTYAVCEITQTDWYQSFPYAGATVPAGESVFDCTQLTPNSGGTFAAFGIQFTTTSGTDLTNNVFGNYLVPPGCTLTQGYWKTHSTYGPAAHPDDTWYDLPGGLGPDTPFFDSGQTWYQVFNTTPKGGNAWYILAHQYMAAVLNQLNGAGDVPGLASALSDAATLLDNYDAQKNIPKKTDQVLTSAYDRDEALAIADFLTQYNEGQLGIPHCGESGFTGFTTVDSSSATTPAGAQATQIPIMLLMLFPLTIVPLIGFLGLGRRSRKEKVEHS